MVGQMFGEILKRRAAATAGNAAAAATGATAGVAAAAPARAAAIAANAEALFASPHQVTLGNPDGDVTVVEFFDYSCGYCKRALPDLLALLKDDPKLKVVLKEFPILGPGSAEAARVAIAVRMQDPSGAKYLAFHQQMLTGAGPASKDKALAAAAAQGLDMARLATDMASDEVSATLTEDARLASSVGATGTPAYVVGKELVVGAVGIAGLKDHIDGARRQAAN
jgi:protein-disulfide isomerase